MGPLLANLARRYSWTTDRSAVGNAVRAARNLDPPLPFDGGRHEAHASRSPSKRGRHVCSPDVPKASPIDGAKRMMADALTPRGKRVMKTSRPQLSSILKQMISVWQIMRGRLVGDCLSSGLVFRHHKAREAKVAISCCMTDSGGHVITLERMDGGRFHTLHSCTAKACAPLPASATTAKGAVGQDLDISHAIGLALAAGPERWTAMTVSQGSRTSTACWSLCRISLLPLTFAPPAPSGRGC